jgi:para-aminobenzoate synthetase component 1
MPGRPRSWSITSSSPASTEDRCTGIERGRPYTDRVLELWDADDPFGRLDRYLRDQGFLDPSSACVDDRIADVYLGYGLSRALRRTPWPDPPEPARLPLLACAIRTADEPPPGGSVDGFRIGEWQQTWSPLEHQRAIGRARMAIAAGEVYQVNLVQHLSAPYAGDARAVARALDVLRPRHGRLMQGDGWAILSASPELFLSRRGDALTTMPIKGTRPRGGTDELRSSAKDAAEHVMIVDLERNDMGRVCVPGTVAWPELMTPRSMAGVEHLVSSVTGRVRPGLGLPDLLAAMFPGGSVTGAPKIAAIDQIAQLEPVGRGASMGALGVIHPNGDFDLALTIRTFAIVDDTIHLWVGGGIVWDSDPAAEVEESWVKARPLLAAIDAAATSRAVPAGASA